MEHSEKPFEELRKAQAAIEAMKTATSVGEFERQWKSFLHHVERIWSKSIAHFGRSPRWNGWKGSVERLRRTDPLLAYLVNARGAEEHTVGEIVETQPGTLGIGAASGNALYVERMEIDRGRITIKSPQAIRVQFTPARMKLLAVTNRGRSYPVPTAHLGAAVQPDDIPAIANAGLAFYADFLARARAFFV